MKTIQIYKAQAVRAPVESVTIVIDEEAPDISRENSGPKGE